MRTVIFAALCGLLVFDLSSCAGGHGHGGGGGSSGGGISNSGVISSGVGNTGVIVGGAGVGVTTHPFTGSTKKK
jgi:hypothetical protein